MANNCYNHIQINGSKEEIQLFWEKVRTDNVANGTYLYLELCEEFVKEKNNNDARWFDLEATLENEEEILITGDSAWCPSLFLFLEIAIRYKSFKIVYWYEEMGCDFSGRTTYQNGKMEDESYSYWEGIAVLDPGDYLDRARNEFESYETETEFLSSDIFKYCPKDLKPYLLDNFNNSQN